VAVKTMCSKCGREAHRRYEDSPVETDEGQVWKVTVVCWRCGAYPEEPPPPPSSERGEQLYKRMNRSDTSDA
jgi:hypothetical protein